MSACSAASAAVIRPSSSEMAAEYLSSAVASSSVDSAPAPEEAAAVTPVRLSATRPVPLALGAEQAVGDGDARGDPEGCEGWRQEAIATGARPCAVRLCGATSCDARTLLSIVPQLSLKRFCRDKFAFAQLFGRLPNLFMRAWRTEHSQIFAWPPQKMRVAQGPLPRPATVNAVPRSRSARSVEAHVDTSAF